MSIFITSKQYRALLYIYLNQLLVLFNHSLKEQAHKTSRVQDFRNRVAMNVFYSLK